MLPSIVDVVAAAGRIKPFVKKTPIVSCSLLNAWMGHDIYFKVESQQKVGAFKARGACNTLAWLKDEVVGEPFEVVASSSGNHAQAVAWAATIFGVRSTVYMPRNVSAIKAQATAAYGAEVVFCESRIEADAMAARAAESPRTYLVPPFNHAQVIAGQGTAAFEALQELGPVDAVFAPCGGGGLLSGTLIATRALFPKTKVIGAEPLNANDAAQSIRLGAIQRLPAAPVTLADGAMPMAVGDMTFEFLKQLDGLIEVGESDIQYWTQWLNHLLKVAVEPTSAMSMEAVRQWLRGQSGRQRVLVILSGGNMDQEKMRAIWEKNHLVNIPGLEFAADR